MKSTYHLSSLYSVFFEPGKTLPATLLYSQELIEKLIEPFFSKSVNSIFLCLEFGELVATKEVKNKKTKIATITTDGTFTFSEVVERIVQHLDLEILHVHKSIN